ncbi:unnamed protein product [Calicophoron daubneyi]|uniref:Protein saal1 n=1 Tax=Calicophoron daubneyi TaxID=300641 RepID=A0AAV2SZW7_CALDB
MSFRNPSPPHGLDGNFQNVDNIGDTAYSKRWLFTLVMDVMKLLSEERDNPDTSPKELDKDIEKKMCCLWDLTINHDIIPYLEEFDIVTVFTDCLTCHRYPRLLEISSGILANLAYEPKACQKMCDNENFVNRVINLFYCRDTPTLTEVCRLVQTVLASDKLSAIWIDAIRFQADFIENLLFILTSSTNGHLLIAVIRLLDAITREDDSLAEIWCGSELLKALLVAQHQMKWVQGNEVEIIHRLLYTFSSNVTGVTALMNSFDELLPTFGVYLRKVCEDEPHLIPFPSYYNSLRAIIPVIDAVLASTTPPEGLSCFASDETVLPNLIYVALGCQQQVNDNPLVRGILADLNVLFKDLVKSTDETLQVSFSAHQIPTC